MRTVYYLAVFGLIASAMAHFSTYLGINPQRVFPPVWALHVLVLVVWIPMIFDLRHLSTEHDLRFSWNVATRNAPRWMRALSLAICAYAFFNFFFTAFVLNEGGVPEEFHGKKVIHNHGEIIRELTDEEYDLQRAYTVRGFSGIWMVFFAVGMTALNSSRKEDQSKWHGGAAQNPPTVGRRPPDRRSGRPG